MEIIKPETKRLLDERLEMAQDVSVALAKAREAGIEMPKEEERLKNAVTRMFRIRHAFFGE